MEKNHIKNLIVRRVLPLACTLLLTGCGTSYEMPEEYVEAPAIIEEEHQEESENIEPEKKTVYYDTIDETGIFFGKVLEEDITWEDVVLTNSERGSEGDSNLLEERKLTQHIEQYLSSLSEEEQAVIDRLNVRRLGQTTFLSPIVTDYVENHSYTSLYVEEKDDLNWNILFDTLKANFQNCYQEIYEDMMNAESEEMKQIYQSRLLEELSDEDLENWIRELHAFILIVREDVPNIDMRRLACILENYVVGYEKENIFNFGSLAQTNETQMIYPIWSGYYPDWNMFEQINYHEFYHLISSAACQDEKNDLGQLWGAGINIETMLKYDEEFAKEHGLLYQKYATYFPFGYSFYEEGDAERYSSSILGLHPFTYFDKQFAIQNLEFSLFLQQGFEPDNLRKANLLHNPIAFVQQFPVLDEFDSKEEDWLYAQLEMLECYNIITDQRNLVNFYWDAYQENPDSLDDTIKFRIPVLENYADLQCFRNFVWTLINVSNTDRQDVTLEDCYYLMHIFEKRLEMQRKITCKTYGIENMDTEAYIKAKGELLNILMEALRIHYQEPDADYNGYDFENAQLSNAFSEEEKRYLATLYVEIDDYYKGVSESLDGDSFEKMKVYYIVS